MKKTKLCQVVAIVELSTECTDRTRQLAAPRDYVLRLKFFHLCSELHFPVQSINTRSTDYAGTVFAYGVTSSGKTHTMHVSYSFVISPYCLNSTVALLTFAAPHTKQFRII